ncbi:MAG: chemotaxis protein CheD [Clostridia bacterium]|nr:chemotaxis protein CheD [Clostridia bacterium]
MAERIVVGISDYKTTQKPSSLLTYALGSCVGVCLRDSLLGCIGMAHILLPDSTLCMGDIHRPKFADTAIPDLLSEMIQMGASRHRLTAKIAGGARLFGSQNTINIGERNVQAVRSALQRLQIPLIAEDTGADYGRTIEFFSVNGQLLIRSVKRPDKII